MLLSRMRPAAAVAAGQRRPDQWLAARQVRQNKSRPGQPRAWHRAMGRSSVLCCVSGTALPFWMCFILIRGLTGCRQGQGVLISDCPRVSDVATYASARATVRLARFKTVHLHRACLYAPRRRHSRCNRQTPKLRDAAALAQDWIAVEVPGTGASATDDVSPIPRLLSHAI